MMDDKKSLAQNWIKRALNGCVDWDIECDEPCFNMGNMVDTIAQAHEEETNELKARMGLAMDGYHEVQFHCGHPMGCVRWADSDEIGKAGTAYCEMCRLEAEEKRLRGNVQDLLKAADRAVNEKWEALAQVAELRKTEDAVTDELSLFFGDGSKTPVEAVEGAQYRIEMLEGVTGELCDIAGTDEFYEALEYVKGLRAQVAKMAAALEATRIRVEPLLQLMPPERALKDWYEEIVTALEGYPEVLYAGKGKAVIVTDSHDGSRTLRIFKGAKFCLDVYGYDGDGSEDGQEIDVYACPAKGGQQQNGEHCSAEDGCSGRHEHPTESE